MAYPMNEFRSFLLLNKGFVNPSAPRPIAKFTSAKIPHVTPKAYQRPALQRLESTPNCLSSATLSGSFHKVDAVQNGS
jgi:hypothetical protein